MNPKPCPCCSGKTYEECCAPYHAGEAAPTPLALMRSRYSGYALDQVEYIIQTTHPNLKQTLSSPEEIKRFCEETQFEGLKILEAQGSDVTFRVYLSREGRDISFTEKSHFEKFNGRWTYHSGQMM